MRSLLFISLLLALSGCSTFPKKMVGQFDAQNGDFIVIKKDGALHWSPLSKTGDKLAFVGIASPEIEDAQIVSLVVPSASPFIYSKITFSPDYSHVTVDWGGLKHDAGKNRATEYDRQK